MLYTSRFQNPELKTGNYTVVRISLGAPRWKIAYSIAGAIKEIMPAGLLKIEDINEFAEKYYKRLDSFGVDVIRQQLQQYESFGKPVVLCCFEDVRKGGINNWCHRTIFAKWWKAKTGEDIEELQDNSLFKIEGTPIEFPSVSRADLLPKIKFVLTGNPKVQAYKKINNEEVAITFEEARRLLIEGKAGISDIELAK